MSYTQKALAAASALLMGSSAVAAPLVLEGNYVKIGVNDAGTVGSGGATSPGILYDSTGTSTFNPSYDYLTPGNPFEGFTVKGIDTDGTTVLFNYYNNNNSVGGAQITGTLVDKSGVEYRGLTFDNRAVWSGSVTEFDIEHDYRFNDNQQFVDINTRLEFKIDVPTLYFGRFTDPDARAAAGDSSSTLNVRGYAGGVPATNVVLSEALASKYALGLFTAATNSNTGISAGWSTDPLTYYGGQDDGDGDYTIGMAFMFSGINTGDIINIQYAYIFGPSSYDAASGAVAGGAGGSTSSSFTVSDVGSASAPTAAPATPTLVSTATAPSTTLPVLTVTLTEHTASEDSGVQTIKRDHTANTTTPMVTTDTYSDGSTTSTLSNSVSTTRSSDSLSGRVDQHEVLDKIGGGFRGLLNHTPSSGNDKVRVFSKNYLGWSSADNGYTGNSKIFGGGFEIDVKPTWTVGAQYNNMSVNLDGTDSTSKLHSNHYGLFSMLRGNTLSLRTNVGLSQNAYSVSRNVAGVFNNDSATNGQEWWLNNRVYWHVNKKVTPFLGYTVGGYQRDAFSESGSVQSARNVAGVNKTTHTGEAGVSVAHRFGGKKNSDFGVGLEASVNTDADLQVVAAVDYKETVFLEGIHQIQDGVNNSAVSAKVKFRF